MPPVFCENSLPNQALRWVESKSAMGRYLAGLIGALSESAASGTLFGYFGLTVIRPTRKLSVSGVKARLAALLIMAIRVR